MSLNKLLAICGVTTVISLSLGYLIYTKVFNDKNRANDSDESGDD